MPGTYIVCTCTPATMARDAKRGLRHGRKNKRAHFLLSGDGSFRLMLVPLNWNPRKAAAKYNKCGVTQQGFRVFRDDDKKITNSHRQGMRHRNDADTPTAQPYVHDVGLVIP